MKKLMATILTCALLLSLVVFPASVAGLSYNAEENLNQEPYKQTFEDIPTNHWAFTYINDLVERGAVNGFPDGKFYPNNTVTRQEFAKMMIGAAGMAATPVETSSFADVSTTHWASPFIEAAKSYMNDYRAGGQTFFVPTDDALREDMAVAVVKLKGYDARLLDLSILDTILDTMFSDADTISEAAKPYVALAVAEGFISGYPDGTFRGQGTISRCEAAAILWRAFPYYVPTNNLLKYYVNEEALFSLDNNWSYSTDSGEKDIYIESIYATLFEEFVRLFGRDAMTYKPAIIHNNPNASNPKTSPLGDVTVITLHQEKTSYWSQLIFQLSHEMMHYAFFSKRPDADLSNYDEKFSQWNEEIICEAMALYMLDYMAENWEKCALSERNATYDAVNRIYLENEYNDSAGLPMKSKENRTYSPEEFKALSDQANSDRENHNTESNYLYDLLVSVDSENIKELLNMYDFYNEEYDYIDYISWQQKADNSEFIAKVSAIQPQVNNSK